MDILVLDLDIENNDREKLLSHLAGKLYDMNYVDEKYLKALLKREREYPAGLVVKSNFNVALFHTQMSNMLKERPYWLLKHIVKLLLGIWMSQILRPLLMLYFY